MGKRVFPFRRICFASVYEYQLIKTMQFVGRVNCEVDTRKYKQRSYTGKTTTIKNPKIPPPNPDPKPAK